MIFWLAALLNGQTQGCGPIEGANFDRFAPLVERWTFRAAKNKELVRSEAEAGPSMTPARQDVHGPEEVGGPGRNSSRTAPLLTDGAAGRTPPIGRNKLGSRRADGVCRGRWRRVAALPPFSIRSGSAVPRQKRSDCAAHPRAGLAWPAPDTDLACRHRRSAAAGRCRAGSACPTDDRA